jgi:hypothetical protein
MDNSALAAALTIPSARQRGETAYALKSEQKDLTNARGGGRLRTIAKVPMGYAVTERQRNFNGPSKVARVNLGKQRAEIQLH